MDDRKLPPLPEPYSRQWINCPFTERLLFTEDQMHAYARAALAAPPAPAMPAGWSVFNSGAHVASGLSYAEALDYLTPERLARGWSAVCIVDKDTHGIGTDAQAQKGGV